MGATMKSTVLEVDHDGYVLLEFELPANATDDEIAYIESLVPRLEAGLLQLRDPDTGDVIFSCRPEPAQEPMRRLVRVLH